MDRWFAPQWAGGWTATRVAYALAALWAHLPRVTKIADAYAAPDMAFSRGPLYLGDHWLMTVPSATAVWAAASAGLVGVLIGGRWVKPGLVVWLVAGWLFMSAEALNIKAYDRLMTWIALAMLLAPVSERNLTTKWRSPVGRWLLLLVYMAMYGSTGWLKILHEPAWWTGEALAYHLVHPWFGSFPLGTWVSAQAWLTAPMSWYTVLFEASFPLLILMRRTNPWVLLAGIGMHAGILSLMDVGPFSWVSVAAYPALLHPEVARRLCFPPIRGSNARRTTEEMADTLSSGVRASVPASTAFAGANPSASMAGSTGEVHRLHRPSGTGRRRSLDPEVEQDEVLADHQPRNDDHGRKQRPLQPQR